MSKAERTREFIIQESAIIFNKKGYAGTSISDITEATRLTKGSIYNNFKNKDEVALAVFKYNVSSLGVLWQEIVDGKKSATDKLIAFTDFYRTNLKGVLEKGGCPILNASIEADDNLPFMKIEVRKSLKIWANWISNIIEEGKRTNEFNPGLNAMDYAFEIIALIEGGVMLFKITSDKNLLFNSLDRIVSIVKMEMKK